MPLGGEGGEGRGPGATTSPPLTEAAAGREIAAGIARALDLRADPDGERFPAAGLGAALRDQALLLVLDELEGHVAGAPVLADLLQRAPRLRLLVTSRTRLRLYGERTVEVGGLALPESADELEAAPASALFLQSAGGAAGARRRRRRSRAAPLPAGGGVAPGAGAGRGVGAGAHPGRAGG